MELTATAAPDGYTVLFSSASYAAAMALRQSSYGMLSSLVPVSHVAAAPYVVTVHPSLPTTMQGLLDLARAKPGDLGYASTGIGGLTHLATELLLSMAKVRMTHVPYKGAGAAMPDVLAGRTPVLINPAISMVGHYQTGRLRPLAVTGSTRLPDLPDVPPVQDTVPGYVVYTWYGIFAPRGTPGSAIGVLNTTMNRILDEREVKKTFCCRAPRLPAARQRCWVKSCARIMNVGPRSCATIKSPRTDAGSRMEAWSKFCLKFIASSLSAFGDRSP